MPDAGGSVIGSALEAVYTAVIPTLLIEVGRRAFATQLRILRRVKHEEHRVGAKEKTPRASGILAERRADWRAHGTAWTLAALGLLAGYGLSQSGGGTTYIFTVPLEPEDVGRLTIAMMMGCVGLLFLQFQALSRAPRVVTEHERIVSIVNALGLCSFAVTLAAVVSKYQR